MTIEIYRKNAEKYGVKACMQKELYIKWTPERIKSAFNFGSGIQKDFERYKETNKKLCLFMEV